MIVTTTNSIEGREISRYYDPIAAKVVIGTNIPPKPLSSAHYHFVQLLLSDLA